MRYPIRLQARFRIALLFWGALPPTAYVDVNHQLRARFGFFALTTPLSNIQRWEIDGPYRWYRAIGVRGTWGKPEITFGGSTHGGIGLFFREPVRFVWPRRLRALYLTIDDLEAFATTLVRRGIPGADVRVRRRRHAG
jgi:hypothetical protein